MAQTKQGAIKIAAAKHGISYHQYIKNIKDGFKWCSGCKEWHFYIEFGFDSTRNDGLSTVCIEYRKILYKRSYKPKKRISKKGCRISCVIDGDKKQARGRVNHLVKIGLLPNPNCLKCSECNNTKKSKRNEYHHHNGYGVKHHEDVIVLCSSCHAYYHKNSKKR